MYDMVEMKLAKAIIVAVLLSLLVYYLPTMLVEKGVTVKMLRKELGENVSVTLHENQTTVSEKIIQKAYPTSEMEYGENKFIRLRESLNIDFIGSIFISILTALTISVIIKKNYLEKE